MFDKDNKFGFINNNENSNNNIEGLDNIKTDVNNIKTDLGDEELTTVNKNVKGAINEVNAQYKDIANYSLVKHTDGKVYIKKQDGTLIGTGVEVGNNTDLSKVTMAMSGQTLKLLNDGKQIATVEIPTAVVTDEQLTSIIQSKIDDGTLSNMTIGNNSITYEKLSKEVINKFTGIDATYHNAQVLKPNFYDYIQYNKLLSDNRDPYCYINLDNLQTTTYTKGQFVVYSTNETGGILSIKVDASKLDPCSMEFIFFDTQGIVKYSTYYDYVYADNIFEDEVYAYSYAYNYAVKKQNTSTIKIGNNPAHIKIPEDCMAAVCINTKGMTGQGVTTDKTAIELINDGYITVNFTPSVKTKSTITYSYTEGIVKPRNTFIKYGLNSQIADKIWEAKEQWIKAYNGNRKRIPIIVVTDIHGKWSMTEPMLKYLADIVPWNNVSKFLNLGDCVFNYIQPYENGIESTYGSMRNALSNIPNNKLINILGNHDTVKNSGQAWIDDSQKPILDLYFGASDAKYFNSTISDFVVYDDKYNIKYVALGGWNTSRTQHIYSNTFEQIESVIKELEKDDGYDIILISHCPLAIEKNKSNVIQAYAPSYIFDTYNWGIWELNANLAIELWNGLYEKKSGTVLDSDGTSHNFNFENKKGNLLCGIHGHTHDGGWYRVGQTGVLDILCKNGYIDTNNATYDNYLKTYVPSKDGKYATTNASINSNTVTFILIDREEENVKIWNVSSAAKTKNEKYGLNYSIVPFRVTPATTLTLSNETMTANVGDKITITATTDSNDECVVWRKQGQGSDSVLINGDYINGALGKSAEIECISAGTVTIICTSESSKCTKSCTLTIT